MTKFRKIGLVLLSALFALCAMIAIFSLKPATASAAGTAVTKGDVDNDGDIDLDDIILVRQYLAGLIDFTDAQKEAADVAGKDNQITLDDAIRMEQYVAGMNVTFEYACEHTFDAGVVTVPTCTEQGYTTYTCTNCGYSYQDNYTDALGHSYDAGVVIDPTCTEQGYTMYTCTVCGGTHKDNYTDALGHSYDAGVVTKDATCEEDGEKTYTCETCGDTYTEVIPANGHNYEAAVTDPTCTEQGYTTYTCTVCGGTHKDNYTNALGHSYDAGVVTKAATCEEDGENTYICETCGDTYTKVIPANGHNYEAVVTAPTCTEQGYTTYICSVCGGSYIGDYTDATGHGYKAVVTVPTCTEQGYTTYTCSVCSDSYIGDYTEATGHSYTAVVTAPTCTEQGYTTYTCSVCGDSYVADETEATGHSYAGTVTKEATCTEDGEVTYTCLVCGDTYTEAIPATGHNYGEWTVSLEPALTSTGTLVRTCANDSSHKQTASLPALNRMDYTYTLITAATCATEGKATYSYNKDEQYFVFSVTTAKTAHTEVADAAVSATCTSSGLTTGLHCSVCGQIIIKQTVISATGHTPVVIKEGVSATCSSSGLTEEIECSVCGYIIQEQSTIAALSHTDSDHDYICDTCGELSLDESECTLISSITGLENIISDMSGNYILTCDLNLSSYSWSPIGSTSQPFTGLLYGNGYVINGLSFDSTDNCGLFISNAGIIANLTINNFACNVHGGGSFGGFAVYNSGSIINCSVTGASSFKVVQGMTATMSAYSGSPGAYSWSHSLGGICAENSGTIENCSVTGTYEITIYCSSNLTANVIVGLSSYWMSCTISADLGLITGVNSGTIENCSVSATSAASITAYAYSKKCKSTATVNVCPGALVGVNKGTVSNSQGKKMTITTDETTEMGTSGTSYSYTDLNVSEDSTYKGLFGSNSGTISKVIFLG